MPWFRPVASNSCGGRREVTATLPVDVNLSANTENVPVSSLSSRLHYVLRVFLQLSFLMTSFGGLLPLHPGGEISLQYSLSRTKMSFPPRIWFWWETSLLPPIRSLAGSPSAAFVSGPPNSLPLKLMSWRPLRKVVSEQIQGRLRAPFGRGEAGARADCTGRRAQDQAQGQGASRGGNVSREAESPTGPAGTLVS